MCSVEIECDWSDEMMWRNGFSTALQKNYDLVMWFSCCRCTSCWLWKMRDSELNWKDTNEKHHNNSTLKMPLHSQKNKISFVWHFWIDNNLSLTKTLKNVLSEFVVVDKLWPHFFCCLFLSSLSLSFTCLSWATAVQRKKQPTEKGSKWFQITTKLLNKYNKR